MSQSDPQHGTSFISIYGTLRRGIVITSSYEEIKKQQQLLTINFGEKALWQNGMEYLLLKVIFNVLYTNERWTKIATLVIT